MADNNYSQQDNEAQCIAIEQTFIAQQRAFIAQPYLSLQARLSDLKKLKIALIQYQDEITTALAKDFGHRSVDESKIADIMPTVMGINYAIKQLKKWMKPSKRHVGVLFQPAKAFVMYQPLGVIGIITPWNYPVFLSLGPLTGALAAGNRAMIKMSEFTPETNKVLKTMLLSIFSEEKVAVFTGGVAASSYFSQQPFHHLLFTGSSEVGKQVMAEAAKNLTPVTLELGGKSPVILDETIDIDQAVCRFLLGKTLNAGQTCVAPDYILCPEHRITALKAAIKKQFLNMYPQVADNPDYTAIINDTHFRRLNRYLADAQDKGAVIESLCHENKHACEQQRKMPLTLVSQVNDDMSVMKEEIFGPILPIVGYQTLADAIHYINARPRPLALYLCSFNAHYQQEVMSNTHAGGVCINEAALHVAQDDLPFGGVGASGMGQYHGYEGFLTFSKAKPIFKKGNFSTAKLAFPPYNKWVHKIIYRLFLKS